MGKKIDYANLGKVNTVVTQNRIEPDPNMPPLSEKDLEGVKMITPATIVAPVVTDAATEVISNSAPQVTQTVETPEAPVTPEGTPSVPSDGITQVEQISADTSTDDSEAEIKDTEVPEGVRKRLSKLTIKRKEAEARALALELERTKQQELSAAKEVELEFYKGLALKPISGTKTEQPAPAGTVVTPSPAQDKEPEFDDFSESDNPISAFVKAHSAWAVKQAIKPIEYRMDPAVIEKQRKDAEIVAARPDFNKVVTMDNPSIKMLSENPITNAMIPASHDKLELAYYLATNPADAQRIASMTDPADIGFELRSIREKMKTPVPATTQTAVIPAVAPAPVVKPVQKTNAPIPFKPVNPSGTAPTPDPSTLSPDELRDAPGYEFLKKRRF